VTSNRHEAVEGGPLLLQTLRFAGARETAGLRDAWRRVRLRDLQALIQSERCGTWLLRRLTELGLDRELDPPLLTWLMAQVRAGAARNMLIESRALDLGRWLTARGVPFVFLKGTARRLAAGLYPGIDARVTTDVDVLIQASDARSVWTALQEDGYQPASAPDATPEGHHHLVPLTHVDGVAVELHTSTTPGAAAEVEWHRSNDRALPVDRDGLRLLIPAATEMLWQSVTHAEIDGPAAYDLRHFQDAAVLLATAEIQWPIITARFAAGEIRNGARMRGWLAAAAWLAGVRLPAELDAGPGAFDLERALRWRYSVCRSVGSRPRVLARLLDEATRSEAGLGMARCLAGTPLPQRVRRRTATTLARCAYLAWRTTMG
jgi:hypothetical protein